MSGEPPYSLEDFLLESDIEAPVASTQQERINDALEDLNSSLYGTGGSGSGGGESDGSGGNYVVVSQDGTGDYERINGALHGPDWDSEGGTIIVESGTYNNEDWYPKPRPKARSVHGLMIGWHFEGNNIMRDINIVGKGRPKIPGWVQILDPGITFEGFEVTGEVTTYSVDGEELDYGLDGAYDLTTGLSVFDPGVTIRDVTVTDAPNGVYLSSDTTVENCTVENYSNYGMYISGGDSGSGTPSVVDTTVNGGDGTGNVGIGIQNTGAVLVGNTVTGNEYTGEEGEEEGAGIAHFSGTGVEIRENVLKGNDDGLWFEGTDAGGVEATRNDIVNNRVGIANEGSTAVSAGGNWWGSSDGPGKGTNTMDTEGSVDASTWSTAAGPNWNTDGTP